MLLVRLTAPFDYPQGKLKIIDLPAFLPIPACRQAGTTPPNPQFNANFAIESLLSKRIHFNQKLTPKCLRVGTRPRKPIDYGLLSIDDSRGTGDVSFLSISICVNLL